MREKWGTREIKDSVSIAQALSRLDVPVGSRGRTRCPIPGCTPSKKSNRTEFSYSTTGWTCFRCGQHGDVIDLVRCVTGCGFREAAEWFSGYGISIKKSAAKPRMSLRSFWADRRNSLEAQWSSISSSVTHQRDSQLCQIKARLSAGQIDDLDAAMLSDMAREVAERQWYYLDLAMSRMSDLYRKELMNA